MSARGAARRFPLYSFLARESPASLPAQPGVAPSPFTSPSNPFAPTKASPLARSWTAPKYSLRRQKKLRIEAANLGYPEDVLPPPFVKPNAHLRPKPSQRLDQTRRALAPSQHVPASKVLAELGLEKYGPYAGRKGAPFKGKMWERKKEERTQELARLLAGADQKIAAWKKVRFPSFPSISNATLTLCLPFHLAWSSLDPFSLPHRPRRTSRPRASPHCRSELVAIPFSPCAAVRDSRGLRLMDEAPAAVYWTRLLRRGRQG